jgi:membrane protein involved in colicin uptake
MSRAGKANTNALAAISAANAATSAANTANSTATAAATSAAAAAASAAQAAFLAACANDLLRQGNTASVNAIYGGSQCPTYTPGVTP